MEKTNLPDSPSFVDLCTLHQHAMRYYRLWIYACNTVLAVATLVFTVFAVSVIVDPRITLISGVELYQPTFLYAYVALLLQCGVLQTIGCLGALRLNQRLLNLYWSLLLVLMIGDIIVGLIWAFRLDRIKNELRPNLKLRLEMEYGRDPEFTQVWDWVQSHEMCCGVIGPEDFNATRDSAPFVLHDYMRLDSSSSSSASEASVFTFLPGTCCTLFSSANFTSLFASAAHSSSSVGRRGSASHLAAVEARRSQQNIFQPMKVGPGGLGVPGVVGGVGGGAGVSSTINLNNVNAHTRRRINASGRRHHESKTDPAGGARNHPNQQQQPQLLPHHLLSHGILPNGPISRQSQIYPQYFQEATTESYQSTQQTPFPGVCQLPPHLLVTLTSPDTEKDSDDDNNNSDNFLVSSTSDSPNFKTTRASSKDLRDSNSVLRKSRSGLPDEESSSSLHTNQQQQQQWNLESTSSTPTAHVLHAPPSSSSAPYYSARWESSPETTFPTPPPSSSSSSSSSSSTTTTRIPLHVLLQQKQLILHGHNLGCAEKILEWLDHVTDILFVIGFCIIVFLKGCFLAILRYEIKEMIQKIRLLNGEDALRSATMNELIGLTSIYAHDQGSPGDNGENGGNGENGDGNGGGGDGASAALLGDKRPQGGGGGNGGAESTLINTTTMDSSLSNNINNKHHQQYHHHPPPHIMGNHVGVNKEPQQQPRQDIIEEDFDSSSALLGRVNSARRGKSPFEKSASLGSAPPSVRTFTLPKNGNNNLTTTTTTTANSNVVDSHPNDSYGTP